MENSGICRKGYSAFTAAGVFLFVFFAGVTSAFAESAITVIPDASTAVQVVNFVLLVILLNIVLYKPIRGILAQRKEKIEGLEEVIKSSEVVAKEKEDEFNSGIREARSKGVAIKDSLVEEASSEEKKILGELNEKAQADMVKVRGKISKEIEDVRETLQKEIDAFASAVGEKILGRAL